MAKAKAKEKKKVKEKEHFVYMIYDESSYGGNHCEGESGRFGEREPEHRSFTPKGLRLKTPDWSETIKVDFDPSECEHLYVVVVRYADGDTFGTSHGNWHIEGAYKGYYEAEKIKIAIKDDKYPEGKHGYLPWKGYFEYLEGVSVERLDIWR